MKNKTQILKKIEQLQEEHAHNAVYNWGSKKGELQDTIEAEIEILKWVIDESLDI